jgi:para-aminobenzoate synthetase component 1
MTLQEFKNNINLFAANEVPFFFVIDFEMNKPFVCTLDETKQENILYDVKGKKNIDRFQEQHELKVFRKIPVIREKYFEAFNKVVHHINRGDTYLVNLTFPTALETNLTLEELFYVSRAPYRLLFKNEFLVFSPECFVRIINDQIFSYPMKGTIDASIPGAEEKLLSSKKELYEHNTIVDLIRNDLSIVSECVMVTKFRYIDKIVTNEKDLLQVSSEIRGNLIKNWKNKLADILIQMLPAGSVSGAPKRKTVEIIRKFEKQERGYFTGIFGIFDGKNLESAVNIRYIERQGKGLQFRSGGGITAMSDAETEYDEMVNKVYVPAG